MAADDSGGGDLINAIRSINLLGGFGLAALELLQSGYKTKFSEEKLDLVLEERLCRHISFWTESLD